MANPPGSRELRAKVRVADLATRQFGRLARRQLLPLGVDDAQIGRWRAAGDLRRVLPGVYAVGHTAPPPSPRRWLRRSCPGAVLTGVTAAWWLGLSGRRPGRIFLRTPRRCRSLPGIEVYGRRPGERTWHRELPVAPVAQMLLDLATVAGPDDLRYALAHAEYSGWPDLGRLQAHLGRGRRGSAALRDALHGHEPQLARTRSE